MYWHPSRNKIKTPIEILNIVGAGGLEFSSMIECWGEPASGKSTFAYQVGEIFLEQYKDDAIVLILDSENSANLIRLNKVFNLRPCNTPFNDKDKDPRVFLEPAHTLEEASFTAGRYIENAVKNNKFLYIIWDSITVSRPKAEKLAFEEAIKSGDYDQYKAGMMLKPRVLKSCLNDLLNAIYLKPVVIMLINQATTSIGKYHSSVDSSGGYGLKHDIHYRLNFELQKRLGETELYRTGTMSHLNINKSKHGPALTNVPVFIYDTLGGKISIGEEVPIVANTMGLITQAGGWYKISADGVPESLNKSWRLPDLIASTEAREFLKKAITDYFRKQFKLLDWAWEAVEEMQAGGNEATT